MATGSSVKKVDKSLFERVTKWSSSSVGIIFWSCIILLLISLAVTFHIRAYTSDDVIWQNALLSWRPFHHGSIYYADGTSSYIAKVPIYWVLLHVFSPGRKALLAAGVLFSVGNFILIYSSCLYFLKRWGVKLTKVNLLPFLWLASFGYALTQLFMTTNMHNIEIGIMFAIIALASKIYSDEIKPLSNWSHKLLSLIACMFIGTMIVDDEYLVYFCILPLILLTTYLWFRNITNRRRLAEIAGLIVGSIFFDKVVKIIMRKSDIQFMGGTAQGQFVNINSIGASFTNTVHGLFLLFGADFWGRDVASFSTLVTLVNAALLFLVIYLVIKSVRQFKTKTIKEIEPVFFAVVFVLVFSIYTFSNLSVNLATYRYLIMTPFIAALLLAYYMSKMSIKSKQIVSILLILGIGFNVFCNIAGLRYQGLIAEPFQQPTFYKGNSLNFTTINILEANGLYKGYSGYWDANINSYLSGGVVNLLPTVCNTYVTSRFYWLLNAGQYNKPTKKSFYLYNPGEVVGGFTCSINYMNGQFGKPVKIISIPYTDEDILVYNYDIGTRFMQ